MNDGYTIRAKRARMIFEAIAASDDPVTRKQIADSTGKNRLSPNDIRHLRNMVKHHLIEEIKQPDETILRGEILLYRVNLNNEGFKN